MTRVAAVTTPPRLALAVGAISFVLGCQRATKDDAVPVATPSASAVAAPAAGPLPATPEGRSYTKFRVTGSQPAEVEAAMRTGWKLVNCSLARAPAHAGGTGPVFSTEHCYFEGDEHAVDVDTGSGHP